MTTDYSGKDRLGRKLRSKVSNETSSQVMSSPIGDETQLVSITFRCVTEHTMYSDRWERQERISWWNQKLVRDSKILVVGAGALGNEVCKNLALVGVAHITVIDYDVVEDVNLSRSILLRSEDLGKKKAEVIAKRMEDLCENVAVEALSCNVVYDYGAANYRAFDAVLIAVDNLEARKWVNRYSYMWNVPVIDGGLDGLICSVQVVVPPDTSCLECTFGTSEEESISEKYSCDGLALDTPEEKFAMVVNTAAIAAGIMVQETLKILHSKKSFLAGRRLTINGNNGESDIVVVPRREKCRAHKDLESEGAGAIDVPCSNDFTVGQLRQMLREAVNETDFEIHHDSSIMYGALCSRCGTSKEVLRLAGKTRKREMTCESCGEELQCDTSEVLILDDRTLADHGVPANHVLELRMNGGETRFVALTGDSTGGRRTDN